MARSDSLPSVASLDAARRRLTPISDAELLHRLLHTHGAIVGAGLDLQRVAAVVMRHVQELTHSSGAAIELLDGEELVYWAASGSVESQVGTRVKVDSSLSGLAASTGKALLVFAEGGNTALVAEGVETQDELATLRNLGVTHAQGFCLGRPCSL